MTIQNLYRAYSTDPTFKYRGYVFPEFCVIWYVKNRSNPVLPYEQLIAGYSGADDVLGAESVDEMFTDWEIEAFKEHRESEHGWSVTVCELLVPIALKGNEILYPLSDFPTGRSEGHVSFTRESSDQSLLFDYGGYFELGSKWYRTDDLDDVGFDDDIPF